MVRNNIMTLYYVSRDDVLKGFENEKGNEEIYKYI